MSSDANENNNEIPPQSIRMYKIQKKLPTPNAGEDVDQQELSLTAGGNVKWCSHFGRQSGSFQKTKPTLTIWSNNHAPWYTSKGIEN